MQRKQRLVDKTVGKLRNEMVKAGMQNDDSDDSILSGKKKVKKMLGKLSNDMHKYKMAHPDGH